MQKLFKSKDHVMTAGPMKAPQSQEDVHALGYVPVPGDHLVHCYIGADEGNSLSSKFKTNLMDAYQKITDTTFEADEQGLLSVPYALCIVSSPPWGRLDIAHDIAPTIRQLKEFAAVLNDLATRSSGTTVALHIPSSQVQAYDKYLGLKGQFEMRREITVVGTHSSRSLDVCAGEPTNNGIIRCSTVCYNMNLILRTYTMYFCCRGDLLRVGDQGGCGANDLLFGAGCGMLGSRTARAVERLY